MTDRFGYKWISIRSGRYRSRVRTNASINYSNIQTANKCLYRAIKRGDRTKILFILNHFNLNLKAVDKQGNTILHYVIENERLAERRIVKILKIFLARGVDPNVPNCKYKTALHLAMTKRMAGAVELLLKYKAHIEEFQDKRFISTYMANESDKFWRNSGANEDAMLLNREMMESKSGSLFELLLSKGLITIDTGIVYIQDLLIGERGITRSESRALHSAVRYDLLHILPVWLKYMKEERYLQENDKTLLHTLFDVNNRYPERPSTATETNWYADYRKRYVPGIVKTLLDRGVSPLARDKQGLSPLCMAIKNEEDIGIIELVSHFPNGSDESTRATSLLSEMVSVQWSASRVELYQELLDGLISKDADVHSEDECGKGPVQRAVSARNLHAVKYLRGKGVDLGVLAKNSGDSLLHILAEKDVNRVGFDETEETLFEWLVNEGCQVTATNASGNSPLHVAATCGNLTITQKLVDRGAVVDSRNDEMQTPLHCSARNEAAIDVAEFLINAEARVNSRDIQGFTPLHFAATVPRHINNMNMVKLLLNRGAYPDTRDKEGDSVLVKTIRHNEFLYARELIEHGANISSLNMLTPVAEDRRDFSFVWISIHYLKMQLAKLPYLLDYRKDFEFHEGKLQQFQQDCLKEIKKMKGTPIDSRTSLYQFLHMDPNSRCIHINNEKLKDLVNPSKLAKKFPKYATVILASYRETVTRKVLLEPAKEAWLKLTNIALPDICVERILSFVNNDDMVIIIDEE